MTKQIRILTGCHAGARLNLHHGAWRLGSESDADIQISDWQGEAMLVEYREDGTVMFGAATPTSTPGPLAEPLHDLVARRCGDTVLCVGPADAQWPSDMTLLQTMLSRRTAVGAASQTSGAAANGATNEASPTAPDAVSRAASNAAASTAKAKVASAEAMLKRPGRRGMVSIGACTLTVAAVIGFTVLFSTGQSNKAAAAIRSPEPTLAERQLMAAQAAIGALHQRDLLVQRIDGRIVVSGIVQTPSDALATTRAIGRLKGGNVDVRFAVADSIAEDLRSMVGEPGIDVRYQGNGVFAVSGVTRDLPHLQHVLARAKSDYGTAIRRFDNALTETAAPPKNVNAMLNSDDVQYVQLRDGTKDFSAATP